MPSWLGAEVWAEIVVGITNVSSSRQDDLAGLVKCCNFLLPAEIGMVPIICALLIVRRESLSCSQHSHVVQDDRARSSYGKPTAIECL